MGKVSFRTNVLLKNIIGKDLITDDNIAVQELVKNSFDAGSTISRIEFINTKHNQSTQNYKRLNNSQIIISDFGKGMSEFDLENKWLNIAYSEKKEKKQEYNRQLAGNKGVGRFSCDRLGKLLTIFTKEKGGEILKLHIDWRDLEQIDDINLNIQDIKFDLESISLKEFREQKGIQTLGIESFESGTILCIQSLREEWDRSKILSLKRQIEKLISPNQTFNSEKFEIEIVAGEYKEGDKKIPEYDRLNGLVENKIFEKLNFKVTSIQSKVTRDGSKIITILKDQGTPIFTLVESNPYDLLKNIKTNIFYLNPYSKAYFKRQTGIRLVDFGSISLFINGFRIPPYGDAGDDWLGIEARRGQGTSRYLGRREVVGRVEVFENRETSDDEDDEFKIISSRSGVRDNKIFRQLAKSTSPFGFYYKAFRRLERFVVEGISWDSAIKKNIEKDIENDPDWDESKEQYKLDQITRNRQILSVVDKIIGLKQDDIIKLYINKEFISDLIETQIEKLNEDLSLISEQLKSKNLTSDELNEFLKQVGKSQEEIESFSKELGSRLTDVSDFEKSKKNLVKSQSDLHEVITNLKSKLDAQEKSIKELEEAKQEAERHLEFEKEKNTYLRASSKNLSEDAKGLIHNIKLTSKDIRSNVNTLIEKISRKDIKEKELLRRLSVIKFNSEKALKISRLITRSNFKTQANTQVVDIAKYIEQYIAIYSDIYENSRIEFQVRKATNAFLEKKISVLELSLVFDDLISNSDKAGATKILIDIDDSLDVLFSDNGKGLDEKFINNPESIFELGITTTEDGSGIGLHSVRKSLSAMKASIEFVGNKVVLNGATFKISF